MPTSRPGRRTFLRASAASLLAGLCVRADEADPTLVTARARRFLVGLLDPELDLLPEFRGSTTYWLYHDNYLAAKVLERAEPATSARILAAIRRFGVTGSGKIEILFGEAKRPLPFRRYRLEEVRRVGEKVIRTEVVGDEPFVGWEQYADLLLLAAIAESGRDRAAAVGHFEAGLAAWDGTGFRDQASAKGGLYATYKLALALIAAARLGRPPAARAEMLRRLLAMQRPDGGFITDYDPRGKAVGQANVETTALAILALDAEAGR